MNKHLVDNLSVTHIKRSKRAELVEIAKDRNIEIEQVKTVGEMREVIIEEVFGGEELTVEPLNPIPRVGSSNVSSDAMALKQLEWEIEQQRWEKESEREKEKELARDRERQKESEREKEKELARDRERQKEREIEKEREKDKELVKDRERQREREMEKEKELANDREREKDRVDREDDKRFQLDKLAKEHELKMELEDRRSENSRHEPGRITDVLTLTPVFDEDQVEVFFEDFESMAKLQLLAKEKWSMVAKSKFIGKAIEAYQSLGSENAQDYDLLKSTVLKAYQITSEGYRQQFRQLKKLGSQTYMEFVAKKSRLFDQWSQSQNSVGNYDKIREMVILEAVKEELPVKVKMHLEDHKICNLGKAAESADDYCLVHKDELAQPNICISPGRRSQIDNNKVRVIDRGDSSRAHHHYYRTEPVVRAGQSQSRCSYCHMDNHVVVDCFKRKRDNSNVVALVQQTVNMSEESRLTGLPERNKYDAYISPGKICDVGLENTPIPVAIYRDTGAGQSLIVEEVLNKLPHSYVGKSVVLTMLGGECITVPLHEVYLSSKFLTGKVVVGVVSQLPFTDVQLLLGNDLSDKCCQRNCDKLVVHDVPVTEREKDELISYPACATTRSMTRQATLAQTDDFDLSETFVSHDAESEPVKRNIRGTVNTPVLRKPVIAEPTPERCDMLPPRWDKASLVEAQKSDQSLKVVWEHVVDHTEVIHKRECFYVKKDNLMKKYSENVVPECDELIERYRVVVPTKYRGELLSLAHEGTFAGHLGRTKTYKKLGSDFYWPGMYRDTSRYCESCHVCQVTGKPNQKITPVPLVTVPIVGEAFSKVLVDIVGPLPKSKKGNVYLLTIMCLTTRFPEAIPLKKVTAAVVAKALIKYFTMTGLPTELQSDRGSNFQSKLFHQVLSLLAVHQVKSSAYHPESQGALERFHQSLKSMLRCHCMDNGTDWEESLPYVLFAARDANQASLGFSPFELVFGHTPRGPLKLIKEKWLVENSSENLLNYVARVKDQLWRATELARKHLTKAQLNIKTHFDKQTKTREYIPGDKVLLYLPIQRGSLQNIYFGPYVVNRRVSTTGYVIETPDRERKTRLCHINLLKTYHDRLPITPVLPVVHQDGDSTGEVSDTVELRLSNSEMMANLDKVLEHLEPAHRRELSQLIKYFSNVFPDSPSVTNMVVQDVIVNEETMPIKQHAYRINPYKRDILKKEIDYMLTHGILEPSNSPWASPVLLIPKGDNSFRVCADLRRVNQVIKGDSFPLPRLDDCIDRVGRAQFITKLDLLKGYYAIPLTERAKHVLAIVTPDGLYQFRVMPFGLKTAPAAFQRMMNCILANIQNVSVYLDDVVLASDTWEEHLNDLSEIFRRLQTANLTINLAKCEFSKASVTFLGHTVGHGCVAPLHAKTECINQYPAPVNRREVRRFLGMAGYYRRFCSNFATVAAPITSLLKKGVKFEWTDSCQKSFGLLKQMLASTPVMAAPDFRLPFKLAVDASDVGAGAVLFQENKEGLDHPVSFYSKKFDRHQVNYSTVEKEALAMIQALKHFEIYLKSALHPVVIFTDNNPLTFIHRMKANNQRILRWSLLLQDYQITIRHWPAASNIIADALSRA